MRRAALASRTLAVTNALTTRVTSRQPTACEWSFERAAFGPIASETFSKGLLVRRHMNCKMAAA